MLGLIVIVISNRVDTVATESAVPDAVYDMLDCALLLLRWLLGAAPAEHKEQGHTKTQTTAEENHAYGNCGKGVVGCRFVSQCKFPNVSWCHALSFNAAARNLWVHAT